MPNKNLIDFRYETEKKHLLLRFADSVHRKTIYPMWRGHKVTFIKNPAGENSYKIVRYKNKYKCITYLFFIITMPLLPLTFAIKCLSKENKRKFKEMNDIDSNKKAKAQTRKMARQERRMLRELETKKKIEKEKIEEEVIKRIESPVLGKMHLLIKEENEPSVQQEEILFSEVRFEDEMPGNDSDTETNANDLESQTFVDTVININDVAAEALELFPSEEKTVAASETYYGQSIVDWFCRSTVGNYFGWSAVEQEIPQNVAQSICVDV